MPEGTGSVDSRANPVYNGLAMAHRRPDDPILSRFRTALTGAYGDRLERVVLFGSRARGDFRPDSDYDIAVFIREPGDWFDEVIRLATLGTDIPMETGAVISAKPFRAGADDDRSPLMRTIQDDGVDV